MEIKGAPRGALFCFLCLSRPYADDSSPQSPLRTISTAVMAGLVPAIHVFVAAKQDVDARRKAGHDDAIFLLLTRFTIAISS
jgi:hypothetical protein